MGDIRTRFMIQDDASSKLSKIASTGRQTEAALKQAGSAADNAFKTNSINAFKSAMDSAFRSASSEFEKLGVDVDNFMNEFAAGFEEGFADAFAESFDEAADAAKEVGEAAREAGRNIESAVDPAKELGDTVKEVGDGADDIKKTGDAAKDAGDSMGNASDKAVTFSDAIKKVVTAVAGLKVLKEIKDFTMDSINLGMNYTAAMSEVAAISGASAQELAQLEATAREYGATTVFSAQESAEALKYMSLAGWDAEQSASALGGVLDLAASSGMGLGEASDMVTDYLSAFGMEAEKAGYFADMLSYAQSNSNTSAMQLGQAYLNSAANLHAAGQDIETTTSMLEAMANQGTKGSRAGTQLAAIMRDITNGMENGAIKIGKTSVAVADESGAFRDLTEIMRDVEKATDGMEDAQRAVALSETFTADSTKGLNQILTEGVDKIADYEEQLRSSAGAASMAAAIMNDNLTGDLKNMNSAWEETKIQVYEALEDPLREGVQYITSTIIPAVTEWVPKVFESVSSELSKIGNAIKPLFELVLKNPKAVMNAFASIGTGLAVFKGIGFAQNIFSAATGVKDLTANVGGLSGALINVGSVLAQHPIAAAAAAGIAGLVALNSMIDEYKQKQVDINLNEHFGDLSLDNTQISELAGTIVPINVTAELHTAEVKFEEAEELKAKAQTEMGDITSAIINVSGVELTEDDVEPLIANEDAFRDTVKDAIEAKSVAAQIGVRALLGPVNSSALVAKLRQWEQEDEETVDALSSGVTKLFQEALDNGTMDVNTAAAIQIMNAKVMQVMDATNTAELRASLGVLSMRNRRAGLDAESWSGVVTEATQDAKELADAEASVMEDVLKEFETAYANHHIDDITYEAIKNVLQNSIDNRDASSLVEIARATYDDILAKNYETELNSADESLKSSSEDFVSDMQKIMEQTSDGLISVDSALWQLGSDYLDVTGGLGSDTSGALLNRYQQYSDLMDAMREIIDNTDIVPENLMEYYNKLTELGAAAEDGEARAAYIAQQIADKYDSKKAFETALEDSGMYIENLSSVFGQGFETELERAFKKTGESVDTSALYDGLLEAIDPESGQYDWNIVKEKIQGALEGSALEGAELDLSKVELSATGNPNWDALANALQMPDTAALSPGLQNLTYTIQPGDNLTKIANEHGTTIPELQSLNNIADANVINAGATIKIPGDGEVKVEADVDGYGKLINDEIDRLTKEREAEPFEIGLAALSGAKLPDTTEQPAVPEWTDVGLAAFSNTSVPATVTQKMEVEPEVTIKEQDIATQVDQQITQAMADEETIVSVKATPEVEVEPADTGSLLSGITNFLGGFDLFETLNTPIAGETKADVKVEAGDVDAQSAFEETQAKIKELFGGEKDPVPFQTFADIMQENNAPEARADVEGDVASAFAPKFTASSNLDVTLVADYKLANPSATINFGGGATGTATVTASVAPHALGGIFDVPHIGLVAEAGTEAVIPLDGSNNAFSLWEQAGQMLGAFDGGGAAAISPGAVGTWTTPTKGNASKEINLNINGSGNIRFGGGGVSKEQALELLQENLKPYLLAILEQEEFEEGDGTYDF